MKKQKSPSRARQRALNKRDIHRRSNGYSVPHRDYTPIHVEDKIVGGVTKDVFSKSVIRREHFYHNIQCYCFDISSLEQAREAGARWVKIFEKDTGRTLWAKISMIFAIGLEPPKSWGDQIGLHIRHWIFGDKPQGEQLSFWEVP